MLDKIKLVKRKRGFEMSTRATYQFYGQWSANTTVYIHYDGYPEGAAIYFWNMYNVENKRGGYATQFIRANDNAEITTSHEGHADTEYRYTVDKDGLLKAEKPVYDKDYNLIEWEIFFVGHFTEFINKYANTGFEDMKDFEYIYKLKTNEYGTERISYYTEKQLKDELEQAIKYAEDYKRDFPEHTGNISSNLQSIRTKQERLLQLLNMKEATLNEQLNLLKSVS